MTQALGFYVATCLLFLRDMMGDLSKEETFQSFNLLHRSFLQNLILDVIAKKPSMLP